MKQNETKCSITAAQETAISLALAGKSDVDIAQECDVSRSTLWRWKTKDAAYIVEFNRRRKELWAASERKLCNLVPLALEVFEKQLGSVNESRRVQAAVHILRAASFYGSKHYGSENDCLPDSEDAVRSKQEADERKKESDRKMAELLSF
ncbi:MAG: phBC6A51 family helix-turn-helix protein [Thermoleophilia bacterium]